MKISSTKGMSISVTANINGHPTKSIVDSAAMITLVKDSYFREICNFDFESKCILKGIGTDPVTGNLVPNVPLTIGGTTILHTVCVAPIAEECILGLDILKPLGCVIDLCNDRIIINDEVIPATIDHELATQVSRVVIAKRTVLPPNSAGYINVKLESPIDSPYIVEPLPVKHALVSSVYGSGTSINMKVINDSDTYVTFKKGKYVGHAEPACLSDTSISDPETHSVSKTAVYDTQNTENSREQFQYSADNTELPDHLVEMYNNACVELSPSEQNLFKQLLLEFPTIFSKDDLDLGRFHGVEHKIETVDDIPIKEKHRRTPLMFQNQEKEYIDKLLQQNVIEPSSSEWSSAPVLVRKKKTGELRYCIDYRSLNSKTIKDTFNIPLIDDCIDSLYGRKLFCVLDLSAGFYQIPLEEKSKDKTSFSTRFGSFRWTRMPMGLCNSPATFQRAMQLVLRGLTWEELIVYLDDIIVLGINFESTLKSLRNIFIRFRDHNLKLKPKKCQFFKKKVEFLGKLVSEDGTAIAPDKIEAVKTWTRPVNVKQLQSFWGFMNYHRNHIPNFAEVTAVLYELSHAKYFVWENKHEVAFTTLKNLAVSSEVLAHPSPDGLFILDTDACGTQIAAELSQIQNGVARPICYASHVLMKQHRNYCTTRKELLAVVKFCRQFRHYLLGRKFIVRTDHNSLVWLTRFKHIEGQLARWLEELAQYNMQIVHRKGSEHINADSLSRIRDSLEPCDCYSAGSNVQDLPCGGCSYCTRAHQQWARFDEDVDDVVPLAVRVIDSAAVEPSTHNDMISSNWIEGLSSMQVREAQLNDPDIGLVLYWLEHGYEPSTRELKLCSPETRSLWLTRSQLLVKNGVLYYLWSYPETGISKECLVVPHELRNQVLHFCHNSKECGHLGEDKTLDRLKGRFHWYGMARDSSLHVKQCAACNRNKKGNRTAKSPLGSYHAGYPMERVHLDIVGPFHKSASGNKYILVMVDQFTKWVEMAALPEYNAQITAKAFLQHFIVTFGCPLEVHTDCGKNFESHLFKAFCKVFEIAKTRTTPYHPAGNGQCEIFNRTILQMIRCYISRGLKDWDEHLPLITMALHSMKNPSTGFSANMLMLGRETIQPIDLLLGLNIHNSHEVHDWIQNLVSNMSSIHNLAREKIGLAQLRQKRDYDLKLLVNHYSRGDVVYLRDSSTMVGVSKKLTPPWKGPFIVADARPPLYQIEGKKKSRLVHHDRLKPCNDSDFPLWLQRRRHSLLESLPIIEGEDDDEQVVDELMEQPYAVEPRELDTIVDTDDTENPSHTEPEVDSTVVPRQSRSGRQIKRPSRYDS